MEVNMQAAPKPQPNHRPTARLGFRNILFATDFSPASHLAMLYAGGLARSFGAQLYAVYVQEPINYAVPPQAWKTAEITDEMELKVLIDELKHNFPDVKPLLVEARGPVTGTVEETIKSCNIELLVIGTRGRTGLHKLALGSQAEEILRHATCPVLTVGPHASPRRGERGKIASILFATDFGPSSLAAAPVAVSIAEEYQSRLTLLHVIADRKPGEFTAPGDFGETTERALRDLVPEEAHLWCKPHFIVAEGEPTEKILRTARELDADLIILGVHAPEGVPGAATHLPIATVHRIISQAECPVLTVRKP